MKDYGLWIKKQETGTRVGLRIEIGVRIDGLKD